MYVPPLGDRLPAQNNRFSRALCRRLLKLMGWRLEGELPDVSKMLAIGAPHTTGWDFVVAILVIKTLGIDLSWLGVDWLFRYPLMRSLGGIPVDRSKPQGLVERSVAEFARHERYALGIAPEGSRKKVPWKTGFYRIAVAADAPILLVAIDQQQKILTLGPTFHPSGDFEHDWNHHIRPHYERYLEPYDERFTLEVARPRRKKN